MQHARQEVNRLEAALAVDPASEAAEAWIKRAAVRTAIQTILAWSETEMLKRAVRDWIQRYEAESDEHQERDAVVVEAQPVER